MENHAFNQKSIYHNEYFKIHLVVSCLLLSFICSWQSPPRLSAKCLSNRIRKRFSLKSNSESILNHFDECAHCLHLHGNNSKGWKSAKKGVLRNILNKVKKKKNSFHSIWIIIWDCSFVLLNNKFMHQTSSFDLKLKCSHFSSLSIWRRVVVCRREWENSTVEYAE